MIVSLPALHLVTELAAWARGKRARMRVAGPSMEPTLLDGEYVLIDRTRRAEPGDLVVAAPPGDTDLEVVKRVERDEGARGSWLASDDPERGVDSRLWGLIGPDRIRGVVTVNLSRPAAALGPRPSRHWASWLRR